MTKADLIKLIHIEHKSLTKKMISSVIDTMFSIIEKNIYSENKFSYPGFGTFVVRTRKARVGRNPRNGDEIYIKASKTVGFKPSKLFKEKIQD